MAEQPAPNSRPILHYVNVTLACPFVLLVRAYRLVSPIKKYLLGPYAACRFHPTCSAYALECLRRFPLPIALWKSFKRIARCNPLHPGGLDPVLPVEQDVPPASR